MCLRSESSEYCDHCVPSIQYPAWRNWCMRCSVRYPRCWMCSFCSHSSWWCLAQWPLNCLVAHLKTGVSKRVIKANGRRLKTGMVMIFTAATTCLAMMASVSTGATLTSVWPPSTTSSRVSSTCSSSSHSRVGPRPCTKFATPLALTPTIHSLCSQWFSVRSSSWIWWSLCNTVTWVSPFKSRRSKGMNRNKREDTHMLRNLKLVSK